MKNNTRNIKAFIGREQWVQKNKDGTYNMFFKMNDNSWKLIFRGFSKSEVNNIKTRLRDE